MLLFVVIGVSLLREVLAGFNTHLDTPPSSIRHHPNSGIALAAVTVAATENGLMPKHGAGLVLFVSLQRQSMS